MTDLSTLKSECAGAIEAATDLAALEVARVAALGKKGKVTGLLKTLGGLPEGERREFGARINTLKDELEELIAARRAAIEAKDLDARLAFERADVTLSPRPEQTGALHPITRTIAEICNLFAQMGFKVAEGPHIEDDALNFTALNMPPDHPARQMQDTFYLEGMGSGVEGMGSETGQSDPEPPAQNPKPYVLRTHTSPVQVRAMLKEKPPLRVLAPGRVFRCDSDQTHAPMFHQVEGLVVDEATHMGHLKGTLADFMRAYFNAPNLKLRFRPSYFPFTEPSAEVDIGCDRSDGGLKICEGEDWLEVLGCGMVHPKVLQNCGVDPARYQGYAFGMGVERLAMLKYGIPDLRTFFEADLRWLRHYGFSVLDQ